MPRDETMGPDERARFVAEAVVCRACAESTGASRAASEDNQGKDMDGWYWTVQQRTRNGNS